jgi:hypothetical protein
MCKKDTGANKGDKKLSRKLKHTVNKVSHFHNLFRKKSFCLLVLYLIIHYICRLNIY